jgi:hypothetical protein
LLAAERTHEIRANHVTSLVRRSHDVGAVPSDERFPNRTQGSRSRTNFRCPRVHEWRVSGSCSASHLLIAKVTARPTAFRTSWEIDRRGSGSDPRAYDRNVAKAGVSAELAQHVD